MTIVFNQDGTFNLSCDDLSSVKNFIDSTNSPYIETNEKIDFGKYTISLVNGKIMKTEITDVPSLS